MEIEAPIQHYSSKQLASLYQCSRYTFRKWMRPFISITGPQVARCWTPKQVAIIFEYLGRPSLKPSKP